MLHVYSSYGEFTTNSPTMILNNTIVAFKDIARGVKFKFSFEIQYLFEIIVGEIVVKNPL